MTTQQFKREIEKLGFTAKHIEDMGAIWIMVGGDIIAWVDKQLEGVVKTTYYYFSKLPTKERTELFNAISAYAATPISERGH